jgi:hypothetical protein
MSARPTVQLEAVCAPTSAHLPRRHSLTVQCVFTSPMMCHDISLSSPGLTDHLTFGGSFISQKFIIQELTGRGHQLVIKPRSLKCVSSTTSLIV